MNSNSQWDSKKPRHNNLRVGFFENPEKFDLMIFHIFSRLVKMSTGNSNLIHHLLTPLDILTCNHNLKLKFQTFPPTLAYTFLFSEKLFPFFASGRSEAQGREGKWKSEKEKKIINKLFFFLFFLHFFSFFTDVVAENLLCPRVSLSFLLFVLIFHSTLNFCDTNFVEDENAHFYLRL